MEDRAESERLDDVVTTIQLAIKLCPAGHPEIWEALRQARDRALVALVYAARREKSEREAQGGQP